MYSSSEHNPGRSGLIAGIIAYLLWGFFPIYFKITGEVPPLEILSHRVVWAIPFTAIIILLRKQWPQVRQAITNKTTLGALILSALFIAFNWGLYIWAVQENQILQASLGYYINPLMFVLVGVVSFGEKLSSLQLIAVALASIGVIILTIFGGQFPWIALSLALSFTAYGVIRKRTEIGSLPGLFIETCVLFLPSLAYLFWLQAQGNLQFTNANPDMVALLILAGPLTVLPLVAFAFAARRLRLSTLGFLQFIGPSLQFIIAIIYGEKLTLGVLLCFGFIWTAAAVFIWDAARSRLQVKY
jgi:chloramphenicol-sensitive protein RarD